MSNLVWGVKPGVRTELFNQYFNQEGKDRRLFTDHPIIIRSYSEVSLTRADARQPAKPIYGDVTETHWD